MKFNVLIGTVILISSFSPLAFGQAEKKSEAEFVKESPTIGDKLPDVTVYDSTGKAVSTSSLRGHYTVLTFGCLT